MCCCLLVVLNWLALLLIVVRCLLWVDCCPVFVNCSLVGFVLRCLVLVVLWLFVIFRCGVFGVYCRLFVMSRWIVFIGCVLNVCWLSLDVSCWLLVFVVCWLSIVCARFLCVDCCVVVVVFWACCWLVVGCLPCVVSCVVFVVRISCVLFGVRCLQVVVGCLLVDVCRLLFVVSIV